MAAGAQAWAQIVGQSNADTAVYRNVRSYVDFTQAELIAKIPDLMAMVPAASKEDADKTLPVVLGRVGDNIQLFFEKVPDTTAREEVTMVSRSSDGMVERAPPQTYQYLLISQSTQGVLALREYRTDATGKPVEPTGLERGVAITKGFASSAVLFHPAIRSDSFFRYLGTQKMGDQETAVVAFAQRPGWAQAAIRANVGGRTVQLLVQGVAWIDPASYQIIRLRTDLLAPRPEVGLDAETTDITYGEVRFPEMPGAVLWLPKEVTVTIEWEGHLKIVSNVIPPDFPGQDANARQGSSGQAGTFTTTPWAHRFFRNTHRYSDYKLFSSQSKIVY